MHIPIHLLGPHFRSYMEGSLIQWPSSDWIIKQPKVEYAILRFIQKSSDVQTLNTFNLDYVSFIQFGTFAIRGEMQGKINMQKILVAR